MQAYWLECCKYFVVQKTTVTTTTFLYKIIVKTGVYKNGELLSGLFLEI